MITALFRSRLLALIALGMLMASGPAFAQTDYDTDNDNYIEVSGHAQLNAIRYDLNGDGVIAATDTAELQRRIPQRRHRHGLRRHLRRLRTHRQHQPNHLHQLESPWLSHHRIHRRLQGQRPHYRQPDHQPNLHH